MAGNERAIQGANTLCRKNLHGEDTIFTVAIGMALFLCTLFSDIHFVSILSLVLITLYYFFTVKIYPVAVFRYLHFYVGSAIGITGCIIIEFFEIDLNELSDTSAFQGSLPSLVFSWWVFLVTATICDKRINYELLKRSWKNSQLQIRELVGNNTTFISNSMSVAAMIGCSLLIFAFLTVINSPSFKLSMDRFQYARAFDFGILYSLARRLIRYLIIPCIVVAVYKKSKIGWIALGVYCLHALWVGEKFGSLFSLLCYFAMIYSQKLANGVEQAKKVLVGLAVATAMLVLVAATAASFTMERTGANYILSRLSQQGQLWWKTYSNSSAYHFEEFGDEIQTVNNGKADISDNVGSNHGIYKIMYYTAPVSQVDAKLESGSRYTEAGFASAYYYLGIPGCIIFAALGGILTSTFVNHFLYYLRYNQYIRAFIHLRLYTNMTVFMSMFIFFPFFNKTSIASYLILALGSNKIFKYGNEQI